MRKRVLGNVPHVRLSLVMLLALLASLAVVGCGGGGGGGTPTTTPTVPVGSKTLATVTGIVTDSTAAAAPISGAVVSIAGTGLKATTGADGKFAIVNVPVGTVGVKVLTPSVSLFYPTVLYGTSPVKLYDTDNCPIPIVTQISAKGPSTIPFPLQLFPATSASPPPPPFTGATGANGCPL
jgi:hypothetical protein